MRRAAALALFAAAASAQAAHPGALFLKPDAGVDDVKLFFRPAAPVAPSPDEQEANEFAYLSGPGTRHRLEITSETAAGARRVVTERLEVAFVQPVSSTYLSVVGRLGFALNGVAGRSSAAQGLFGSLGLRMTSPAGNFVLEAGARLLPPLGGIASDPSAQTLALDATITSIAADDTRWLRIASPGAQVYVDLLARSNVWGPTRFTFGGRAGGQATLAPVRVYTWLGGESHFLANLFLEGFVAFGRSQTVWGLHADVSLSSLWPADQPLPLVTDFFVGWSPAHWLNLRGFIGLGFSPLELAETGRLQLQGGLRVQLSFL